MATAVTPQAALLVGTESDHGMTPSPAAPSFSPVSDWEGTSESNTSSSGSPSNEQPEVDGHTTELPSTESPSEPADPVAASDPPTHSPRPVDPEWDGFRLIGDNFDYNVIPSLQRLTHQTQSLHDFHSCAVKDRVNFSAASDVSRSQPVDSSSFVMAQHDWERFQKDCRTLISR